ncbi:DRTGG domain-containing protein [Fusibacter ferrireducens]|uniref:AraC family transcriptional regulator n=1 Tax=Fusibacter ferrireducens TaxID=2785058 RepID=A0ABR9ZY38_9FIRM|nr:DRTGG domain-containing protein [Fusibacter ferrireducens]MBF4695377.1 AraC family transcriptional regulator [Fusibacter ferrireducens]
MKVCELIDNCSFKLLSGGDLERSISSVYSCDLLSWVMAKGKNDTAWITVQTHNNILAVASLLDFSCVIIPEGIKVEAEVIQKANEQEITILSTELETFEIFKIMYEAGIK